MNNFFYSLYDLTFQSDIPLAHLKTVQINPTNNIDVFIEEQTQWVEFDNITYERDFGDMLFKVGDIQGQLTTFIHFKDIGTFWILDGKKIYYTIIERPPIDFFSYLNGLALGTILFHRKIFLLHGAAFATSQGAVILIGQSGSGKTTTAAALLKKGYKILAEDTVALRRSPTKHHLEVLPGLPYCKLFKQTTDFIGSNWESLPPLYSDNYKRAFVMKEEYYPQTLPLHQICSLQPTNEVSKVKISDKPYKGDYISKFELIALHIQYPYFCDGYDVDDTFSKDATLIAQTTPFFNIYRPKKGNSLNEVLMAIEDNLL